MKYRQPINYTLSGSSPWVFHLYMVSLLLSGCKLHGGKKPHFIHLWLFFTQAHIGTILGQRWPCHLVGITAKGDRRRVPGTGGWLWCMHGRIGTAFESPTKKQNQSISCTQNRLVLEGPRGEEGRREERKGWHQHRFSRKPAASGVSPSPSFSLGSQRASGKEECYFSAACLSTVTLVTFPNLSLPSYRRPAEARALL